MKSNSFALTERLRGTRPKLSVRVFFVLFHLCGSAFALDAQMSSLRLANPCEIACSGSSLAIKHTLTPLLPELARQMDATYKIYGQVCDIQKFARDAEFRGKRTVWSGKCVAGVKKDLGKNTWMLDTPHDFLYEASGPAVKALGKVQEQGFYDVFPQHPELRLHPELAPEGAIIIYKHDPEIPCTSKLVIASSKFCDLVNDGHIEVRTKNGFAHEGYSPKSIISNDEFGRYLEVAAVLIKPISVGDFDAQKKCYLRK